MCKPVGWSSVSATIVAVVAAILLVGPLSLAAAPLGDAATPDALIVLTVGDGGGQPGGTALIPVRVIPVDGAKLDANAIAGIDLEITWDASLASVRDVQTTAEIAGWQVAFNSGLGRVRISMAGLAPFSLGPFGVEILQLEFALTQLSGSTALHVVSTRVFDRQRVAIPHLAVDGRLSVSVVGGEVETIGGVKAGYR